jgi:YidC/Oxa1 family membrane protein insertase
VVAYADWYMTLLDSAPVTAMQAALEAMHTTTGLPWWATVVTGTIAFRLALLPVVRHQARAVARLDEATPLIRPLNEAATRKLDSIKKGNFKEAVNAGFVWWKGARAARGIYDVSMVPVFAPPLVQIPVFVAFALANRRMIIYREEGLDEEGCAWFPDLTEVSPRAGVYGG